MRYTGLKEQAATHWGYRWERCYSCHRPSAARRLDRQSKTVPGASPRRWPACQSGSRPAERLAGGVVLQAPKRSAHATPDFVPHSSIYRDCNIHLGSACRSTAGRLLFRSNELPIKRSANERVDGLANCNEGVPPSAGDAVNQAAPVDRAVGYDAQSTDAVEHPGLPQR